ncbi:MAG: DUF350 domain-containing protein [Bacteroidota bacterium]
MSLNDLISFKYVISSVLYSVIGIVILLVSYWIIEKIKPEDIWKEIVYKQNVALAIVCASFMIAIAIIISSAIHG